MLSETNLNQFVSNSYRIIDEKAKSNSLIQGLTGIVGFPYTMLADGAVIFTHYGTMFNEIRALEGYGKIGREVIEPVVKSISSEILFDLVGDKILGQIPVLGIYFNAICAKTMTWRLGILFSMLTLHGDQIDEASAKQMAKKIREAFPQSSAMTFTQPSYESFEKMLKEQQ